MKNIKNGLWGLFILIIFFTSTSCVSMKGISANGNLSGFIDGKQMNVSELPSPKTHTLVYAGFVLEEDGKIVDISETGSHFFTTTFIQLNPERKAMIMDPIHLENAICFLPMSPGMHLSLVQANYRYGAGINYYHHGMQGADLSFIVKKPGLQYLGAYKFSFTASKPYEVYKGYKEIKVLRKMQYIFKDTEWLALIEARIAELGYPKEEGANEN